MEKAADDFVHTHLDHVKEFYKKNHQENDMVISASPEFLIGRFCEAVGVKDYIASEVDIETGKLLSANCYGEEKVRRLEEDYGEVHIHQFYSDSLSDTPLATMAEEAYLVKGDEIKEWRKG